MRSGNIIQICYKATAVTAFWPIMGIIVSGAKLLRFVLSTPYMERGCIRKNGKGMVNF